jgi:anti-sigma factor RsiW
MSACADLVSFIDGEIAPDAAREFRSHLVDCADCQVGIIEGLQLSFLLSQLSAPTQPAISVPTEFQPIPALTEASEAEHLKQLIRTWAAADDALGAGRPFDPGFDRVCGAFVAARRALRDAASTTRNKEH